MLDCDSFSLLLLALAFPKSTKQITYDPYRDQRDRNPDDRGASWALVFDPAIGGDSVVPNDEKNLREDAINSM